MSTQNKLDQVLLYIREIMDDDEKLTQVLEFLETEIIEKDTSFIMEDEDYMVSVPEKYRSAIREIAENMTMSLISFFNPETLEFESIPKDYYDNFAEEFDEDLFSDLKYKEWEKCIEIEPLESRESFRIMERFVAQLPENRETASLRQALNGRKPFANFNHQIHNSDYREDWFAFRRKELEKYVIENYLYDII